MTVVFPRAPIERSLGVGLDLPWAGEVGLAPGVDGRDAPTLRTRRFLTETARELDHVFVSLQARDRARPSFDDYAPAFEALFENVPHTARGLHHTALSLGSLEPIDRAEVLALTAALVERHGIAWVNEDLGFWSLSGKPLPYPIPPVLDARAIPQAVRAIRECQQALPVPLVIEFPGFSDQASVTLGTMHAYDFFRRVAEQSEAPVTLDVGHLLSYQWMRGRRGDALFDELDRLPLGHAFELHLAGSSIVDGHFVDAHHGALLEAQLDLAERLAPLCPALRAITFEDPVLGPDGAMAPDSAASLGRLRARMGGWLAATTSSAARCDGVVEREPIASAAPEIDLAPLEGAIAAEVAGRTRAPLVPELEALATPTHGSFEAVRSLWCARALGRAHRGLGTLQDRFPTAFAAWRAAHLDDLGFERLAAELLASDEALAWREGLTESCGASIEEVFAAFADRRGLGDVAARENDALGAIVRALAVTPRPAFRIPPWVRRRGRGWLAVTRHAAPTLHAAVEGRYLRGAITPPLAALLRGCDAVALAEEHGLTHDGIARAEAELARLGLGAEPDA